MLSAIEIFRLFVSDHLKSIWTKRTKNLMCTIFFSYFAVKIDLIIEN